MNIKETNTVKEIVSFAKANKIELPSSGTKADFLKIIATAMKPSDDQEEIRNEALADSKKAKQAKYEHDACLHAMSALDELAKLEESPIELKRNRTCSVYWVRIVKGNLDACEAAIIRNIRKGAAVIEQGRTCNSFAIAKSGYVGLHTHAKRAK